jgi:3-hydroxybutyryl-CoA dehydrogenase
MMSPPDIASVLVVGAGTMGSGIAQVVAEAGIPVALFDSAPGAVARGLGKIETAWARAIARERRTEEAVASFQALLTGADSLAAAAGGADLVIEAIVEDLAIKRVVFAELAAATKPNTVLASNTSSISITALAAVTDRPGLVVGLHFFNPVPVLPLVEVVRGVRTDDMTVVRAVAFAESLGKTPVVVNDAPGFVSNRVLMPMINEAIFALAEGVASREAIDDVMKLGMSHPIGPLALADLIGLDICLDILETLQRDLGEDKYRPAPLLRRMVAAGQLGRKSGAGFYQYER